MLGFGPIGFEPAISCHWFLARGLNRTRAQPSTPQVDSIRAAVNAVLGDASYAQAAKRVAAEIETMLTPAEAAAILS